MPLLLMGSSVGLWTKVLRLPALAGSGLGVSGVGFSGLVFRGLRVFGFGGLGFGSLGFGVWVSEGGLGLVRTLQEVSRATPKITYNFWSGGTGSALNS